MVYFLQVFQKRLSQSILKPSKLVKLIRETKLTFCLHPTGCQGKVNQTNHESILLKHLMDGYDKNTRPVLNQSDVVTVFFGIAYSELIDMVSNI